MAAFWIYQRYIGQVISDPNNTETIDFWKALMFHVSDEENPHPLTARELFDRNWATRRHRKFQEADEDPELKDHIQYFKAAIQKVSLGQQ